MQVTSGLITFPSAVMCPAKGSVKKVESRSRLNDSGTHKPDVTECVHIVSVVGYQLSSKWNDPVHLQDVYATMHLCS